MADDATTTPPVATPELTPEEVRAARIEKAKRNLMPPCKKGQVLNPKGINGRKRAAGLIRWLEEPSDSDEQKTRAEVVWQKLYLATLKGSVQAGKVLLEQCGRPPPSTAEQTQKLAEHFRQVERDRLDVSLKMLGERINQWPPERVRDFLASCARDPRGFMIAAEEYIGRTDREPSQISDEQAKPPQEDRPTQAVTDGREQMIDSSSEVSGAASADPARLFPTSPPEGATISQPQPSEQVLETPCSTVAAEVVGAISASPPAEGTEAQPSTPNVNNEAGTTSNDEEP